MAVQTKEKSELKSNTISLIVRKTIKASAERLFEAWTQADQFKKWWGPENATCSDVEIDLRIGGQYRIANQFEDGSIVWITGYFEKIDPPHKLVYSWQIEPDSEVVERVTVLFKPGETTTEVIVVHERIKDAEARDKHELGWKSCIKRLVDYISA